MAPLFKPSQPWYGVLLQGVCKARLHPLLVHSNAINTFYVTKLTILSIQRKDIFKIYNLHLCFYYCQRIVRNVWCFTYIVFFSLSTYDEYLFIIIICLTGDAVFFLYIYNDSLFIIIIFLQEMLTTFERETERSDAKGLRGRQYHQFEFPCKDPAHSYVQII